MKVLLSATAALVGIGLLASLCAADPEESKLPKPEAFRMPAGDEAAGRQAFVALNCIRCHSVEGVDFKEVKGPIPGKFLDIGLANPKAGVSSYGQLVTAITNPEHVFTKRYQRAIEASGDSGLIAFMPRMNAEMSVQQLIDLLQFLDARYRVNRPGYEERRREEAKPVQPEGKAKAPKA